MISIIVPVYNTALYLDECIQSIANQTYTDIEIILIDDCSTDDSLQILYSWKNKDKRIRVFTKEQNTGVSDSRNIGLKNAVGDFIMFVDSDDVLHKTICEKLISSLMENKSDIAICGMCELHDNSIVSKPLEFESDTVVDRNTAIEYCFPAIGKMSLKGSSCAKLYPAKLLRNNDNDLILFDTKSNYCEDCVWISKIIMRISTAVFCGEQLYIYRNERVGNTFTSIKKNTKYTISAISAYYDIYIRFKNDGIDSAKNVFQRMLIHRYIGMKAARSVNDVEIYNYCKKHFCRDVVSWMITEKSIYGFIWGAKRLAWYLLFLLRLK